MTAPAAPAAAGGWVDTHGHLHDPAFDGDRDAVAERAFAAGLSWFVDPGVDLRTTRAALEGARARPGRVWAAAGVHPHAAAEAAAADLVELEALLDDPAVVAVGEIGLDLRRVFSPPRDQERVLLRQLAWAQDRGLPVLLHVRDAYDRMLEILGPAPPVRGVVHAFWGDRGVADRFLAAGFHLGIGGAVTFRRESGLRDVVANAPRDRVVLETDAPYLTPVPMRGRRNEPALVAQVGRFVAGLWGVDEAEARWVTEANARRLLFDKDPPDPGRTSVNSADSAI